MFDTNVGDMPIDIFGDYVSDCLDIEFTWEYLVIAVNGSGLRFVDKGCGNGNGMHGYGLDYWTNMGSGLGCYEIQGDGSYPSRSFNYRGEKRGNGHNHSGVCLSSSWLHNFYDH